MKNPVEGALDPEEDLKASNEIMKLKLELDHKMVMGETSNLSLETENQWLNHVYNFEKLHKECGRAKVYDLLGRPAFAKYDALTKSQLQRELSGLLALMEEKNIALDCICEYDDEVIYRFITEELFESETDDIFMEGMVHHFIYEEFHPNHDHDLRGYATRFIESILSRKWSEEYDQLMLTDKILFQDADYGAGKISSIVLAFQEAHSSFEVEKIEIKTVALELEKGNGTLEAHLAYIAHPREGKQKLFDGKCRIQFVLENNDWSISAFELPGFGD